MVLRRIFLIAVLCLSGLTAPAHAGKVRVGDTPPDRLGRDADGKKIVLSDQIGKVVVVTFWATWCAPCRVELPVLESIQRQVGPDQLRVFAVDYHEGRHTVRKILKALSDYKLTFVYDGNGLVSRHYGVRSIPHMFMIGRDGKVAKIHVGYSESSIDGIVDDLNALLAAPRVIPYK